jgi:hypothetical protein
MTRKENKIYWSVKDEEPDNTLRRTGYGRAYGPLLKETTQ